MTGRRQTALRRSLARFVLRRWFVVLLSVGLAVAATWPLASDPVTRFPLGTTNCDTVPLFNVWTIWWNADCAARGFANYWNAPIFYPATNTFAYSEPQPMTLIVAPVIWLTGSRILAYNLYLLLSLVLNGVVGAALLRVLRVRRSVALCGGAAMLLLPIVHWQRDVIQLVPLWPSLWTLAALIRLSRKPRVRTGIETGLAFGVAFLTSGHHGLFLAILLLGSAWVLPTRLRHCRTWLAWIAAAFAASLVVLPVGLKLQEVAELRGFERSHESVTRLSAQAGDYSAAWGWQLVDTGDLLARSNWKLSPGLLKFGFAAAGLVLGLSRRRLRRVTAFTAVFGTLAFALSLGGNLTSGSWHPWWTIAEVVPGAAQVRNVFRFAYFLQVAVVVLAAVGLSSLWSLTRALRRRWGGERSVIAWRAGQVLLLGLGLAAVVEVLPPRPALGYAPNVAPQRGWIEFVRQNTRAGRALACVPFASGNQIQQFQPTLWWMFLGTEHGVPLVNGYSGFFPDEYFSLRNAVAEHFPDESVLHRFEQSGVAFVLVATRQIASDDLLEAIAASPLLERVHHDASGVDVYRIRGKDFVERSAIETPRSGAE
ncbi:hypothetical protein GC176_02620 [bacterium]|nr:hypothetical protein [bacterium]